MPSQLSLVAIAAIIFVCGNCGAPRCNSNGISSGCSDHRRFYDYINEGETFLNTCGLWFSHEDVDWNCTTSFCMSTVCQGNNITVNLMGRWISPLFFIMKCLLSNGSTSETVIRHETDSSQLFVYQTNYSNCTFGSCFQNILGEIFLEKVTTCSFTPEEAQLTRDTTVVPESVPTSRKVSKTSSSTTSDAVTTGLSPEDFKLSSIIILTSLMMVMGLVMLTMGAYILHLCNLRSKKRKSHRGVIPRDADVFDVSFKPVAVDFRVAVSESKESVYFSLDHEYEQVKSQTTPFSKSTVAKYENIYSNNPGDCSTDDDGYTIVKESDGNNGDECHSRVITQRPPISITCKSHHTMCSEFDSGNSSGFISAGFDHENEIHFKFSPICESVVNRHKQHHKDSDETSKDSKAEIEMEQVSVEERESYHAQSAESECDFGNKTCGESSDNSSDSDFDINYENSFSVEDLHLTQEDDAMPNYPCEKDILSSHYISAASGNPTLL